MPTGDKKRLKSESLSLRLDPKTKFILDFIARIRGQSITTVVERAIKETAAHVGLGGEGDENNKRTWLQYWDANEGVRTLKLLADSEYPSTFDEDELREFTLRHWPFFYYDDQGRRPRRGYIEILWPNISRYLSVWHDTRAEDYWRAGEMMNADLVAARVAGPQWPPKPPTKPEKPPPKDLDDEIPF